MIYAPLVETLIYSDRKLMCSTFLNKPWSETNKRRMSLDQEYYSASTKVSDHFLPSLTSFKIVQVLRFTTSRNHFCEAGGEFGPRNVKTILFAEHVP